MRYGFKDGYGAHLLTLSIERLGYGEERQVLHPCFWHWFPLKCDIEWFLASSSSPLLV